MIDHHRATIDALRQLERKAADMGRHTATPAERARSRVLADAVETGRTRADTDPAMVLSMVASLDALERVHDAEIARLHTDAAQAQARLEHEARRIAASTLNVRLRSPFNPHGCFVYCLWGADRRTPLYVGKSTNLLQRLGRHLTRPATRAAVEEVTVTRCADAATMDDLERRLIEHHQPALNTLGIRAVS